MAFRTRENEDQSNSEYGYFLRSEFILWKYYLKHQIPFCLNEVYLC